MRKKRKQFIIALALVLILMFILLSDSVKRTFHGWLYQLYEASNSLVCDEKRGKAVLHELCQSYNQGKVAGNLCLDLCQNGQLIIEQCLSHKNDNVIFSARWRQEDIILKAKKMSSHSSWEDMFPDGDSITLPDLQKNFLMVLHNRIVSQLFNFEDIEKKTTREISPNELLGKLYFNAAITDLQQIDMQNLWQLLRQDEFYVMQILKDFKHIPQIYGTCGKFYALEKVKTLSEIIGIGLFPAAGVTWRFRVKIALEILDFVHEFNSKSVYGFSWQHCDIQPSNLGIDKSGTIKAIDVDLVYTDGEISEILGQQMGNCSSNKDCEFFDCASPCSKENNKCTSGRISNNLQVVCRDLFQSKWYDKGLLANIPSSQSKAKFEKIINECAAKTNVPWTKHKYNRIFRTLQNYLREEQQKI